jgi:hypothetical protein
LGTHDSDGTGGRAERLPIWLAFLDSAA